VKKKYKELLGSMWYSEWNFSLGREVVITSLQRASFPDRSWFEKNNEGAFLNFVVQILSFWKNFLLEAFF